MKNESDVQCEVMREITRLYDDGKVATVSMLVEECDLSEDKVRDAIGFLCRNGDIERRRLSGYIPVTECRE